MGDIVKGAFGAPRKPKPDEPEAGTSQEASAGRSGFFREADLSQIFPEKKPPQRTGIISDLSTLFTEAMRGIGAMGIEMDDSVKAKMQAMRIGEFLRRIQGSISDDTIRTAREIWKKRTNKELLEAAEASTEFEWTKYPGRFRALADELAERSF
jgi:hypothetical protein